MKTSVPGQRLVSVGCNYFSLPLIHASNAQVHKYARVFQVLSFIVIIWYIFVYFWETRFIQLVSGLGMDK